MKTSLTSRQYRSLEKAVDTEIRKFTYYRSLLRNIDAATYHAGLSCFSSEAALVQWLCEPAQALGGKVPITVMGTARGCEKVAGVLHSIAYGIYL
jgi:hypothetical protein